MRHERQRLGRAPPLATLGHQPHGFERDRGLGGEDVHEPALLACPQTVSPTNLQHSREPIATRERYRQGELAVERAHDAALTERAGRDFFA